MKLRSLWVVALVAAVTCAVVIPHFALLRLTPSELSVGSLPRVPTPLNAVTTECSLGLAVNLESANGEWSVIQDHSPCAVSGIALQAVKATATEMKNLICRPLVSFQVAPSGLVSNAKLLRSSGSTTLDERALRLVAAYRDSQHNCGVCKVSTSVNVDFDGPVWIREPAAQRVSIRLLAGNHDYRFDFSPPLESTPLSRSSDIV
jgi:TonB family protein